MSPILRESAFVTAVLGTAFTVHTLITVVPTYVPAQPLPVLLTSSPAQKYLDKFVLYVSNESMKLTAKERDCLVKNVFHEAATEPLEGKIAVAQVTLSRRKDGRWGNDVCQVVYAKSQFSWTLDAKKRNSKPRGTLYAQSEEAVNRFVNGARVQRLDRSLHYHADYVNPKWANEDYRVEQIGAHIFYALQ